MTVVCEFDGVLGVVVHQLEKLQEDRTSLALGEDVRNPNYPLRVLDGYTATEGVVLEELGRAKSVLEGDGVESHGDRRLGVAPHHRWAGLQQVQVQEDLVDP
eukprot:scaffold40750_cov53-Phaeocystis_antarctica.AAC.2